MGGAGNKKETPIFEGLSAKSYVSQALSKIDSTAHIYLIEGHNISINGTIRGKSSSWCYNTTFPNRSVIFDQYASGEVLPGAAYYENNELNIISDDWQIDSPAAIAVAESNGGKEYRESKNGMIAMTLYPSYEAYSDPIWAVKYYDEYTYDMKQYYINAKTGSLEAIK